MEFGGAWSGRYHREQVEVIYKNLQPVIDKDLIYFAYYKGMPIGFFLMFPEMNQVIRHLNGKLNLTGILKFLYYRRIKKVPGEGGGSRFNQTVL